MSVTWVAQVEMWPRARARVRGHRAAVLMLLSVITCPESTLQRRGYRRRLISRCREEHHWEARSKVK